MNETVLKERLKIIAKNKGMTFNIAWKQLLLERFLARLSRSDHHENFIFKGGFLLAQRIQIGRETTDIDFLMTKIKSEAPAIEAAFREIAAVDTGDGFVFKWASLDELTQPHMIYPGFRVTLRASLGKMSDPIQIDIGVGDAVNPIEASFQPFEYRGKPIFEGEITLLTYPVETIFAEKLETIVSKGATNSRMKDYHDTMLMIRETDLIPIADVKKAVSATFQNRGSKLRLPISFDPNGLLSLQRLWTAHLDGLDEFHAKLALPERIEDVLAEINAWLATNRIDGVKS